MKLISKFSIIIFSLALLIIFPLNSMTIYAEESTTHDYEQKAKDLINSYDENMRNRESEIEKEKENINPNLVNDMVEEQKDNMNYINQGINQAANKGEKLYSYDEILNLKTSEISIPEEDLKYIQKSIKNTVKEYEKLQQVFQKLGKANHPLAVSLKKSLDVKFPKSLIFVDHSNKDSDGRISGGGWPYCLDDNGWGYHNFIDSDCQWAYFWIGFCVFDQSGAGMGVSWLRYCKTNIRNCSPLIFHSKYWHTH